MLAALGAVSSVLDILQSLTSQKSSSPAVGQPAANPFDVTGSATTSTGATPLQPASGFSPISPQTMSALIAAQGDTTNTAPTNPSGALRDLFSRIDANGDGSITKTEFENALGAGGTNIAAADDVFGKLDSNGDGTVGLDEIKSALQGAGSNHGHHHMHALHAGWVDGSDASSATSSATSSYNLIEQLIQREAQALSTSAAASLSVSV